MDVFVGRGLTKLVENGYTEHFRTLPAASESAPIFDALLSDDDRERVCSTLSEAVIDGRLTREEYEQRVASVLNTRRVSELNICLEGLSRHCPRGIYAY